jgi:P27 family predicted phage terminase small subunit
LAFPHFFGAIEMRGRKAKPDAEKRMAGNPGKRKLGERTAFAVDKKREDFPPPKHLSATEKALWREEVSRIDGLSLMRDSDTTAFSIYIETLARYRKVKKFLDTKGVTYETASKHGNMTRQRAEVQIEKDCRRMLLQMMEQFAMTSSARIKLHSVVAATRQPTQPELPLGHGGEPTSQKTLDQAGPIGILNTVGNA